MVTHTARWAVFNPLSTHCTHGCVAAWLEADVARFLTQEATSSHCHVLCGERHITNPLKHNIYHRVSLFPRLSPLVCT